MIRSDESKNEIVKKDINKNTWQSQQHERKCEGIDIWCVATFFIFAISVYFFNII